MAVPEVWADKLADCEYLGIVDSSSWYDSLTSKGAEKKFYKNMHKLGATHFMVSGDGLGKDNMASQMWVPKGTYRKYNQSAQAFNCGIVAINKAPKSTSYIDELKALAALRDDGIINEDEFQKQKAEILERE